MNTNTLNLNAFIFLCLVSLSFLFSSCSKENDNPLNNVTNGIYVKGGSCALSDYTSTGMMKVTKNAVNQTQRSSLVELYIALKAGDPGIQIVTISNGTATVLSPGGDFALVPDSLKLADEPKNEFWRGSYVEGGSTTFTVPTDGLYHIVLDTELKKIAILKVNWGVLGEGTLFGWDQSIPLPDQGFDLDSMVFKGVDITLRNASLKFRYSNGWMVYLDTTTPVGGGATGVSANTNFGGSLDLLVSGGSNIPYPGDGRFSVEFTWTLHNWATAKITKTSK